MVDAFPAPVYSASLEPTGNFGAGPAFKSPEGNET
jgi:hypothetical protein